MYNDSLFEEIEALKSIFDKDIRNNGSEIVITLFPLQEKEKKEIHVQVDLCIDCSGSYPEKEPGLTLKNVIGLSDSLLEILYCKLNEMAKSLRGEVMIYNLAYFVQEFLSEHNKPGKKSCYEEMILRKEQQKQEEYQFEVFKKTKLMKDIEEKQKQMSQLTENDSSNYESEEEVEKSVFVSRKNNLRAEKMSKKEIFCEHRNCKYIQFNNKVLRGRCIEHDSNSIIYCAIDSTTGDQLLLQEWVLKPSTKEIDPSSIQKKLEEIQNSLNQIKKLCHKNLISYIDFKWCFDKGEWIIHALQEYMTNFNLNVLIDRSVDLDINFIRDILTSILNGLEYLHSHGVVHGCLSGSTILINKTGVVKLSGYGIKKIIDDLHTSCSSEQEPPYKIISMKNDILDVGLLLLKIMKFSVDKENILVPDFQPPEFKEFVEKCLIENEEGRWTARKLLNHKFLKVKINLPNVSRKKFSNGEINIKNDKESEKPFEEFFDGEENVHSRLSKEFIILSRVGSGSFGKVLKVRNKLDSSIYAIKAIRLSSKNQQMDKKMIREVKLLSKLNHENVVRYYTSWIERDSMPIDISTAYTDSDIVDGVGSKIVSKSNKNSINNFEKEDDDDEEEEEEEDDDEDEGAYESDSTDEVDAEKVIFNNKTDQSSYVQFLRDDSPKNLSNEINSLSLSQRKKSAFKEPDRTMYIQMEFCEKSTLRIAINEVGAVQLYDDENRLWRLFREIVEGLAYVHGQGMIHRDLKPENIFLDSNDHVKIGDFGLATVSVVSKSFGLHAEVSLAAGDNVSLQNLYDDYHTGKVGTSLYVAPELDKTFGKSFYNKKVDIYSLGIIFFEMCHGRFNTDMERIETLLNIRKYETILPSSWNEKLSKQRNLVKKLLNHDPKSRPSCQEILEGNYLPPAEFESEQLQDIMRQTLSNPKSKAYKYLILSCFDQEIRIEEDLTYQLENVRSEKQYFLLDLVKEKVENLLKKHGAVYFAAPLLLPQNEDNKNIETKVKLMTHSGSIVNLPYDLRISFARYLACKAFTRLRRYVVERVYKEKKVHGLHPKEQYECAFDLVAPSRCKY